MGGRIMKFAAYATATLAALVAASPAFAGATPVPAPLLGAGIPALAIFAGGYMLIRRRRRSK
jgi:uncharacterized membrane protein